MGTFEEVPISISWLNNIMPMWGIDGAYHVWCKIKIYFQHYMYWIVLKKSKHVSIFIHVIPLHSSGRGWWKEDQNLPNITILFSRYHGWRWTGDIRNQDIITHEFFILFYLFSFRKWVEIFIVKTHIESFRQGQKFNLTSYNQAEGSCKWPFP